VYYKGVMALALALARITHCAPRVMLQIVTSLSGKSSSVMSFMFKVQTNGKIS